MVEKMGGKEMNEIPTNRKCPGCNRNLNWLTVAEKYDCPWCGWDGQEEDVKIHEEVLELLGR